MTTEHASSQKTARAQGRWFSCGATTIDGAVVSLTGDETAAEEEEKEEVLEEEEERRGGISLRRGGDPITTGATTGSVAMSGEATGILGWSGTASMAEGGAERVWILGKSRVPWARLRVRRTSCPSAATTSGS